MSLTSRNGSIKPLKSRLGCITCKIRKVKCGEEKPQCLRCSSTGRKCEYASTIIRTYTSAPPLTSTPHVSLSPSPNTGSRERRAFAYYFQHAATSIGGGLDADFWNTTVPQICRREPAVWDAMIAISSLFESPTSDSFSSLTSFRQRQSRASNQPQQDALDWYSRSVSAVRQGIERGGVDSFVCLITCLLFICIESILGGLEEATHLYGQGVHLILALWAQKSSGTLTATQASLLRDTIIPIFIRLASFSPQNIWSLAITMVQETGYTLTLPEKYPTLKSAREAIVMLSAEISLFEMTCEQYLQNSHAWQISEDMAFQRKTLSARLETWNIAFTDLLGSLRKRGDLSPLQVSISALLSSYYEMLYVILAVCGSPLRITTDNYIRNFQAIVEKAAVAINHSARNDGTQALYTFELSLGLPLWFTCLRCREPTIRRAALALLRRTHQVQGLSQRDQGAALIELIMMLEETSATTTNAAKGIHNITSPQPFDEFTDYESYSHGSSVSSSPFSTLESEVVAGLSSPLTDLETETTAVTVIPQEARIRPHGAFRLGDNLPPGLTEEDIAMSSENHVVNGTLSLLENVELPYPGGPLLASFVTEALSPVHAAHYLNERLSTDDPSSIVADWTYIINCITESGCPPARPDGSANSAIIRRDGLRCCVTGRKGTFWDPLVVASILPIPLGWDTQKAHISEMLGAFFGPQYRDWWISYIRSASRIGPYSNHWLIRRSVADVFARGFIRLDRLQPSLIEYEVRHVLMGPEEPIPLDGVYPLLGDHSRLGTEKIDPRFIGTHARLCKSVRYLELTQKFAADRLPRVSGSLLWRSVSFFFLPFQRLRRGIFSMTGYFAGVIGAIWSVFPVNLRLAGYGVMRRLGERIYGTPNNYSTVQRLPFGLYLKFRGDVEAFRNEFNALQVVQKNTTIPVPRSLDLAIKPAVLDDPSSSPEAYLLITRLPGQPLSRCLEVLSDFDLEQISYQLKDYLSQLRNIPRTVNPETAICNTLGEACHDPRIQGGQPVGPFKDEAAFSQTLRFSDEPSRRGHEIVFTHADLNPRNILVDRVIQPDGSRGWEVTGIVDWETSNGLHNIRIISPIDPS